MFDRPFVDNLIESLEQVDEAGGDPFSVETIAKVTNYHLDQLCEFLNRVEDIAEAWNEFEVTAEGEQVEICARLFLKAKVWTGDIQTVTFTLLRHGFDFRAEPKAFELELTFP